MSDPVAPGDGGEKCDRCNGKRKIRIALGYRYSSMGDSKRIRYGKVPCWKCNGTGQSPSVRSGT